MNKEELISEGLRTINEEINALEKVRDSINDDFAAAVELLAAAPKVCITGVGKSGNIGRKISATFSSIGKSSVFLHPLEALHGDIGIVQKHDVAILLSKSGSTDEIVRFIPYLKMREAKIISIVGNLNSYLAKESDITLDGSVDREACPYNLAPTTSTTAALALGDALAIALMKKMGVSLEDFSRLHPLGQIGRNITIKVADVMHKDKNLPIIAEDAFFSDAIIEISQKGLGCVCIADDNKVLKGIITDGDVRRTLEIYDDIRELKALKIMTKSPVKISEKAYLGEALSLMENRDSEINVLPVVDNDEHIKGVIRIHDVIGRGL